MLEYYEAKVQTIPLHITLSNSIPVNKHIELKTPPGDIVMDCIDSIF